MSEQTSSEQTKSVAWSEEKRKAIYGALAAPFGEEAIQRTKGSETRKSYDTTGFAYQYIVNRFNEVLGVGGFRVERKLTVDKGQYTGGKDKYTVHCEVKIQIGEWVGGVFFPYGEALADGGHESITLADGVKGAYTNGFKKAAAFFGVGRQAYEGTLDDDNVPAPGAAREHGGGSGTAAAGGGFAPPAPQIPDINTDPIGHWAARLRTTRSQAEFAQMFDAEGGPRKSLTAEQAAAIWHTTEPHYNAIPKEAPAAAAAPADNGKPIADDRDLDSQYGDPDVFTEPRDWKGPSRKGWKFSACEPEYLDLLAAMLDKFASNEADEKKKGFKLRDAARARGWARRLRSGWKRAA